MTQEFYAQNNFENWYFGDFALPKSLVYDNFFSSDGERGKDRSVRATKGIAQSAISEEENRYVEAAAAKMKRKNCPVLRPKRPTFEVFWV
jgi:hypothetical protein